MMVFCRSWSRDPSRRASVIVVQFRFCCHLHTISPDHYCNLADCLKAKMVLL